MKKAKQVLSRTKSKTKSALKELPKALQQQILETEVPTVTPADVLRYRYHHGVNLGSIFVLEDWLFDSMFYHPSPGGSELDAVTTYRRIYGFEATKKKWEDHWSKPISDEEFKWLATEAKVTSIRLPIGYFTLGSEWCVGTPFANVKDIYENAWQKVKDFTEMASRWGIGTLIDFHAVQGGANEQEHSGTNSGKAELWKSQYRRYAATKVLVFIAEEVKSGALQGIVGIQIVNEPVSKAVNMFEWYEDVIRKIGKVDETVPIYIAEAWDLGAALRWTTGRNIFKTSPKNPIVVDTHKYWCFGQWFKHRSAQGTISNVNSQFKELDLYKGKLSDLGEAQIVVGEWSCVLDERMWERAPWPRIEAEERDRIVKQFGHAQSRKWQEKAGGAYFWTYKNELSPEGEWGFETQALKQNILPPDSLTLTSQQVLNRVGIANVQRASLKTKALVAHDKYWNRQKPGRLYDHTLYSTGWEVGFSDALAFFTMRSTGELGTAIQDIGGDKIGCLEIWIKKRLLESGVTEDLAWELEHGFRKGVEDFYDCVGI